MVLAHVLFILLSKFGMLLYDLQMVLHSLAIAVLPYYYMQHFNALWPWNPSLKNVALCFTGTWGNIRNSGS